MSGQQVVLPAGFKDAKVGIVIVAVLGEILQGEAGGGRQWAGNPGQQRPMALSAGGGAATASARNRRPARSSSCCPTSARQAVGLAHPSAAGTSWLHLGIIRCQIRAFLTLASAPNCDALLLRRRTDVWVALAVRHAGCTGELQ